MALDPIKIEQIKKKMLAQGFKEDAIAAAVEEAKAEYDTGGSNVPVGQGTPNYSGATGAAPVSTSSSQPIQSTSPVSKPSVGTSSAPTPQQGGNIVSDFIKSIYDLGANYAKFGAEAVAQAGRAVVDPIGDASEIDKKVQELSAKSRALVQQAKAMGPTSSPEKERLLEESRKIDKEISLLGSQAGDIGNKQKSFFVDEEKIKDRAQIAETGARATAGAMSLVPVGGIVTGGAVSGALQAASEEDAGVADIVGGGVGGAATGAVLKGAGKLVSKGYGAGNRVINNMLNPFAEQFDDDIVRLATEKGVDLPLSAKTSSNAVKQLEATAQKSFFGGTITKRIIDARDQVNKLATELSEKLNKSVDEAALGNIIKTGRQQFEDNFNTMKSELYDMLPENVLKGNATLQSTKEALEKIIADKEASAAPGTNVEYYKTILKNLTEGKGAEFNTEAIRKSMKAQGYTDDVIQKAIDEGKAQGVAGEYTPIFDVVKKTRSDIGRKMKNFSDPVATGDQASLKYLYSALSDDLETTIKQADPAAYEMYEQATQFYREGIQKVNSKISKFIDSASPEKLLDGLVKPNSVTDIKLVKQIIGEEGTEKLKEGFYNKLFHDAADAKTGIVNPKKVMTSLKRYGEDSVKEILGEDGWMKIQDNLASFEDISKLDQAIKRGTKPADGSQTAFLANTMASLGTYLLSPAALLGKLGAEAGLVRMLTTEAGQKWLTEGLGEVAQKSKVKLKVPVPELVSKIVTQLTTLAGAQAGANAMSPDQASASTTSTAETITPVDSMATETPSATSSTPDQSVTSPVETPTVPEAGGVAGIKSKQEMLQLAAARGMNLKQLQEVAAVYDLLVGKPSDDEDVIVDKLLARRKTLADNGLSTAKVDAQLNQMGYEVGSGSTPDVKTEAQKKFGPAVSRALSQLETISGIDTEDTIFQGGSTTIGKALKGPVISGRKATDEKFAQKVNQYSSATNLVIGAINQMLGAGTLNEGDAQRLISTMPNEKTSEADAKAWFTNARSILGVE